MKYLIPFFLILLIFACKKEETPIEETENTDTTSLGLDDHIGSESTFSDNEAICSITAYTGNGFENNGYSIGQKVHDFTLYNQNDVSFNLEEILLEGQPVFIMTGSYTCPAFRSGIYYFNQLVSSYSSDIKFFVAYTVEAHPIIDYSPYFDTVNTTQINVNEGILYEQPTTYGERKNIVSDMLNSYNIDAEVLIDSPCNEFWYTYGEAPNRTYLIDTDGTVLFSQGWFSYPYSVNAIEDYLSN